MPSSDTDKAVHGLDPIRHLISMQLKQAHQDTNAQHARQAAAVAEVHTVQSALKMAAEVRRVVLRFC